MDELSGWWEIAKYVGAGGCFVLGIVCWKLWGKIEEDEEKKSKLQDERRQDAIEAVQIISEFRNTLEAMDRSGGERHNQLITKLDQKNEILISRIESLKHDG